MNRSTDRALEKLLNTGLSSQRSALLFGNQQDVDAFQSNVVAKAAFSIAEVTVEVRVCDDVSEAEVTFDGLALERAKQIRPNAFGPFRSVAAYFTFCRQDRR